MMNSINSGYINRIKSKIKGGAAKEWKITNLFKLLSFLFIITSIAVSFTVLLIKKRTISPQNVAILPSVTNKINLFQALEFHLEGNSYNISILKKIRDYTHEEDLVSSHLYHQPLEEEQDNFCISYKKIRQTIRDLKKSIQKFSSQKETNIFKFSLKIIGQKISLDTLISNKVSLDKNTQRFMDVFYFYNYLKDDEEGKYFYFTILSEYLEFKIIFHNFLSENFQDSTFNIYFSETLSTYKKYVIEIYNGLFNISEEYLIENKNYFEDFANILPIIFGYENFYYYIVYFASETSHENGETHNLRVRKGFDCLDSRSAEQKQTMLQDFLRELEYLKNYIKYSTLDSFIIGEEKNEKVEKYDALSGLIESSRNVEVIFLELIDI